MKILLVQETDWLKRGPHQQHHLAEKLSLRGHEIRVIDFEALWRTEDRRKLYSRRKTFNSVSKIYDGGEVTLVRPGVIKVPWLDYTSVVFSHKREIDRQITEFIPDVIVGFDILNAYLAMRAAKKNMIPFVYYWIDVNHTFLPFKPFQPIGKMVETVTLKRSDRVLAINHKLGDYMVKLGAPQERTQVLGAGINIEQFNPDIGGEITRRQYRIKRGDIVLFFMGLLYHFSGLKEVALELARVESHNIKLLLVGEGDAYSELLKIRDEYNLHDRLILVGKKPYQEIPSFVAASDICLLPAYNNRIMRDIVPIKIYEYMAMGKPVISTKLPGIMREFGKDNGVVYIDRAEDTVATAIELANSGKVKELGMRARSFAERNSWDSITDEFETILDEVIREKQNERVSKRI